MNDELVAAAEDVVADLAERRSYCKSRDIARQLDRDYAPQQMSHVMASLRDRGVVEKWNSGTTGATWLITETNGS
jgi:predicted transcriptional regulator